MTLLRHGEAPVGICVFCSPPLSLAGRNRFFGTTGRWTSLNLKSLSRQLVALSRVVLHPTYRGAGLAAAFVRRSCEACPFPWIETLAQMGHLNPFLEKAGFQRVPTNSRRTGNRARHSALYGNRNRDGRKPLVTEETHRKSRHARPVYYVFDNRRK